MDNLSHSMVGLYLGEVVHQVLPKAKDPEVQSARRKLLLTSSVIASNFPDLDLVFTKLLPRPLGYLLHHRGHTHTLLFLLPQILLLLALILCFPGVRKLLKLDSISRKGLATTLGLGFLFHIVADSFNSYGVHPFYPWHSDWFYGDALFIIEPVFWMTLGVAFGMTVKTKWRRALFISSLLGISILLSAKNLISPVTGAFLITLAAIVVLTARVSLQKGLAVGFGLFVAFITCQFLMSQRAYQQIAAILVAEDPTTIVRDIALTALPTNPACWAFVSIHENQSADYFIRKGQISIFPELVATKDCRWLYRSPVEASTQNVDWLETGHQSTKILRDNFKENCRFNAWLRFARIPFLESGRATDLRFSSLQDLNFSSIDLNLLDGKDCSGTVPQWNYPRADLLFGDRQ